MKINLLYQSKEIIDNWLSKSFSHFDNKLSKYWYFNNYRRTVESAVSPLRIHDRNLKNNKKEITTLK